MEATLAVSVNAPSTLCARHGGTTTQLLSSDLSTQKCCQTGPPIAMHAYAITCPKSAQTATSHGKGDGGDTGDTIGGPPRHHW